MVAILTMSSAAIMNSKMDTSSLLSVNRSKLMKLAEGIKTKKKPNHKKSSLNFKKDPSYSSNIEHLVFGTYRQRGSPSSPALIPSSAANGSVNCYNDRIASSLDPSQNGGAGPKSFDQSHSRRVDSARFAVDDNSCDESTSLPLNLNDHDVARLGSQQAIWDASGSDCIMRDLPSLGSESLAESVPTSPTGSSRISGSPFCSSESELKSDVITVNRTYELDASFAVHDVNQCVASNEVVPSRSVSSLDGDVYDAGDVSLNSKNKTATMLDTEMHPRVQTPTSSCCSASTRSKQTRNRSCLPRVMPSSSEFDNGSSSAVTSPTVIKKMMKKSGNGGGDTTGNIRGGLSTARVASGQPKIPNDGVGRVGQRQSTRERSNVSNLANRSSTGGRLSCSFNYGGSASNNINQRPSASVQTVRKISVSAANPSRPTVSTKVKLTVTSDGANVGHLADESVSDATARGNGTLRTETSSGAKARSYRSSFAGSRNSSRSSLTNESVKSIPSAAQLANRSNGRAKGMPAALSNLQSQGKFSSSSSLASSRRLGSTSSLGGSQISIYSASSAGPSIETNGVRKSLHSINYQRSVSAREVTAGRSGRAAACTRSPNSVPRNSGGRMSLRLPTTGKPPICPSKIARPSPPRDKLATVNFGKEQAKCAPPRNSSCRIPCYKYPKAVRDPPNVSCGTLVSKDPDFEENGPESDSVGVGGPSEQNPDVSNDQLDVVPCEVSSTIVDPCSERNKTVEDPNEPEPRAVVAPPPADSNHELLNTRKAKKLSKSYSLCARLSGTDEDLARFLNGRKPPLPTRSVSVTIDDVAKIGLVSQLGRRRSEFTVSQSDHHPKTPLDSEEVDEVASDELNDRTVCDAVDKISNTVLNTEDEISLKESVRSVGTESVSDVAKEAEELEPRSDGDEECCVPAESCDKEQLTSGGHDDDDEENGAENLPVSTGERPCKISGERSVPKCVRRIKATSSPVFVDSRVDAWVSEGDLRRPWSQICSDQDVERLVQAKSCALDPESMSAGIKTIIRVHPATPVLSSVMTDSSSSMSSHGNLFSRFSSMRNPNAKVPSSSVEGVLQKFRKSFSARFYKKVKDADSPTSVSKSCRHASFSSYLGDRSESEVGTDVPDDGSGSNAVNGSVNHSSISDVSATDSSDGGETVFRLGPIIWRSSKERKEKAKKGKREIKADSTTAASSLELNGLTTSCNSLSSQSEDTVTCKPVSASSTPLPTIHARPSVYPACVSISPQLLRRRAKSTSLRFEKSKRPLLDQGASHGSIVMPNNFVDSRNGASETDGSGRHSIHARNSVIGRTFCSSTNEVANYPPAVIVRRQRKSPTLRWSKGRSNLRRSVSQPLEMEKMEGMGSVNQAPGGLSDQEDLINDLSTASSDEEICSDLENGDTNGNNSHRGCRHRLEYSEPIVYAEALWDHVTMDVEELAFKAGDLIEVLDDTDSEWWWGVVGNRAGWFPAPFVRARVNQEDTVEDCVAKMNDGTLRLQSNRKTTVSLLSNDQVRINVIMEIVSTEKDFVRHLKDVCEGYLKQVRKRPDMFPEERVDTIFANIEQLYTFQSEFVSKLEQCINWEQPLLSQIGSCFTEHREGFEMYSEYCNNHPQSVSELQELYTNPKYAHFFEACRLLQDMIDISLDGFLLTPVQKICKYPLQLAELLKYTKPEHPDHSHVAEALETMRSVAQYINERKRRMECLEKLAAWQTTLEYWEGPNLLDNSSELIHSGDVSKVTAAWSRDFTFFLFDHQIIICKKDLIKRNSYSYKSRIDMDTCEIVDIPDGKDSLTGLTLRNSWKMYCSRRNKWLVFSTRTAEEKQRWMKAFDNERWRVEDDQRQGFVVTENAKKTAMMVVLNRKNPKRPKEKDRKNVNRRNGRSDPYVISSKSGSLPSNLLLSTNKKKTTSGWFHFGSNKKTKR